MALSTLSLAFLQGCGSFTATSSTQDMQPLAPSNSVTSIDADFSIQSFSPIETLVKSISSIYTPCGVAKSNIGNKAKNFNSCSYEGTFSSTSKYNVQYAGIKESTYWDARKNWVNKMTQNAYKDVVEKVVNSERDYRDSNYSATTLPVGKVVNLTNVYDVSVGTKMSAVSFIILHRTMGSSAQSAINAWAPKQELSAHYIIDKNGTIYNIVPEDTVAWHLGKRSPKTNAKPDNSIGIEVVGESSDTPLTNAQNRSVSYLVLDIAKRYGIKKTNVCPHEFLSQKNKNEGNRYYPLLQSVLRYHNNDTSSPCQALF